MASVLASCGPISATQKPNLLLLFPDQWRWDWTSMVQDGSLVSTPNFDLVARNGTIFKRAYVASPLCAPSRAALALGREYDMQQVPSNSFDVPNNTMTYYKALRDRAGYHVMISGKDDLTKHSGYCDENPPNTQQFCWNADYRATELGYSAWIGRTPGKLGTLVSQAGPFPSFLRNSSVLLPNGSVANALAVHDECFGLASMNHPLPHSPNTCCHGQICNKPIHLPDEMYEDNWVGQKGLDMLQERPTGKPWYFQINFPGPHGPFIVTPNMMASTQNRTFPGPVDYHRNNNVSDLQIARQTYTAEVENLDKWFGRYIETTKNMGDFTSTVICISSDHGELLGDHGDWAKSKPWEGSSHVPLVCAGPGLVKGQVIEAPVTTMDLAATWLAFAGLTSPSLAGMILSTSRSLIPILSGKEASNRDFISSGLGRNVSGVGDPSFDFRMVVQRMPAPTDVIEFMTDVGIPLNNSHCTFKYICCNSTCPGQPTNVPTVAQGVFMELLYDVEFDWQEMRPLNLRATSPFRKIADSMRDKLPPQYADACSKIPPPTSK